MGKYLFTVFYLGQHYQGFQRQPNGRAVENHIEMAMIKAGCISSFAQNNYRSVSRTDANVNAIGNVFALFCDKEPNLMEINSYLPKDRSIIVHHYAHVESEFKSRNTRQKTYNYFVPRSSPHRFYALDRIYDYLGNHNFDVFIKKDGAGEDNPRSHIFDIQIQETTEGLSIDIVGDKFGREQIRRMLGVLMTSKYQDLTIKEILDNNGHVSSIKPAPPHYLTLVAIEYDRIIDWKTAEEMEQLFKVSTKFVSNELDQKLAKWHLLDRYW